MRLILASSSPRRSELLKRAGLKFEVYVPSVDESSVSRDDAGELALLRARLKAGCEASELSRFGRGDFIVLGADSVVERAGEIFP